MNRTLVVLISLLLVLICMVCAGTGIVFYMLQQPPVAQATPTARAVATLVAPVSQVTSTAVKPAATAVIQVPTSVAPVVAPTVSQGSLSVSVNKFTNNFPKSLLFDIEAKSDVKITQIALIAQVDGVATSSRQIPEFTADTQVKTTYTWDLARGYMPPGVSGEYWWTVQDSAGNQLQTPKQRFQVDDPAYKWQKASNNQLAVYWYLGGESFGKALFDRGIEAMKFLQQDTGVAVEKQIQIYIYGNRNDFFKALEPGANEWTGGRAFPDYNIIMINVEPSNLEWGKAATTHELTHQIIHQKISGPLGDLSMPKWMDEGLAMYYETYPGKLDSQFSGPLSRAISNDSLATLRVLSGAFPSDSSAANLAYAESYSVIDFMFRKFGKDKMAQLLQTVKQGGAYDDTLKKVFNMDMDTLENEWRKDIGAKQRAISTRSSATPTPFPTFSLSTDATPTPKK